MIFNLSTSLQAERLRLISFIRYNYSMGVNDLAQEFRPVLTNRNGEMLAWLAAVSLGAAAIALRNQGGGWIGSLPYLAIFVGLIAASISLSNWMDRRTVLRLDKQGVFFTNGLRRVSLAWHQIDQVSVFSGALGKRVQVVGGAQHFEFRYLSEVEVLGSAPGRLGFPDGVTILATILREAGLQRSPDSQGDTVYYSRH